MIKLGLSSISHLFMILGGVAVLGLVSLVWLGQSVGSVYAQNCGSGSPKADGLVSAFRIDPNFRSNTGCVTGSLSYIPLNQARIVISDYQALFNKYYARNASVPKISLSGTISSLPVLGNGSNLLYSNGDLTLQGAVLADTLSSKVLVFFVNGKLNIQTNITQSKLNKDGGVVFVVKGNVNIAVNVSEINAVIISGGVICSACDENSVDRGNNIAPFTDPQLFINGSLIALDPKQQIIFTREYGTNQEAAEMIQAQAKYLVILKDIFGERVKIYKEI